MKFNFFKKKYHLGYFCTSIVKHCNLNCRYCDHFSPLAEEEYIDPKEFEKELKQINSILDLASIGILGGEPLLHPEIAEIFDRTKNALPKTKIVLITNGILLEKLDERFWSSCARNKVHILISKFNINLNTKYIDEKLREHKMRAYFYGAENEPYKSMYHMALDLSGSQNKEEMHKRCWQNKGGCNYYEKGKLYKCTTLGNIGTFNKYFNQNLEVTPDDYIDIYKVKKYSEIEDYFKRTINFCRYCNFDKEKRGLKWEVSPKEMSDWTM